jgi:hypothetical protein
MQVEFVLNGGVSLILSADTEAEEALLKQLIRQDNDIIDARSSVVVLNKTLKNAIVIAKKDAGKTAISKGNDTSQEETV